MTKIHKRGSYSAALKEKVSLEALKGEKTLQQIASENSISPELVRQWKKQALEGVSQIFKRTKSREKALEEQNELLKSLLCKREMEREWLTKKTKELGSWVTPYPCFTPVVCRCVHSQRCTPMRTL